jgi:hypothetical protein
LDWFSWSKLGVLGPARWSGGFAARNARTAIAHLAAALACAGCASFSDPRLPQRSLADLESGGRLAAITYQFAEWNVVSSDESLVVATAAPAVMPSVVQSRIEPILRRAFVDSTRGKERGEWHLDMYYRETERHPALTYTLAVFFVASLGLVPAYTETDLYLEAKLMHDGQNVRQYVYEETVSSWIHWFMLPWTFTHDPIERKSEILDNMVLNLVHDVAAEVPRAAPAAER